MNLGNRLKSLLLGLGIIIAMFIMISVMDIVVSVMYARFYSTAAFVATFGVGGVFACIFSFSQAVGYAAIKNERTRWSVIIMIWVTSAFFIYPLSFLEGGEYQAAFISYGVSMILTTFLFVKGIINF